MLNPSRLLALAAVVLISALAGPSASAWADDGDAGNGDGVRITQPSQGVYRGHLRVSGKKRHADKAPATHGTKRQTTKVKQLAKHKLTKTELAAIVAMCRESPDGVCHGAPKNNAKPPTKAQLAISLSAVARTLITKLKLPDPTPRFGPDPSVNEWKMAAVGYPLWLWTDGPGTVTDQVRAYGVTFTLRAIWRSTTFDMGDGHQVTCTRTRVYPSSTTPGTKSPSCGYTYLASSLPKGDYRVTATTNWQISWSALGRSGSIPGSHSGSWSLPVGELNALVVR